MNKYKVYPKQFRNEKISIEKNRCFFIMPFSEEFDIIYGEIKASLSKEHFHCIRVDEIPGSLPVINKILTEILKSQFIIVDLTNCNPNVFYELARLFIKTNELNKLKIVIKAVRNYILDKVSYAKYYAYLGEFYRLKEDYKTAIALYYVSESILETPVAKEGIEYILEREDILNPPATEEVIETLKKDEFEFNLNSEVLGMIYDLSYELSKNLNNKSAMYCLDVLYELTDDEKYLREKEYLE